MTDANQQAPKILDLPIGLDATGMRQEFDSLGKVEVPADRYWGAQTQRSLQHFNIGNDRMPKEVHHAYGYVKKAAAVVHTRAGRLPAWKGELIMVFTAPAAPGVSAARAGPAKAARPPTDPAPPGRITVSGPIKMQGWLPGHRPGASLARSATLYATVLARNLPAEHGGASDDEACLAVARDRDRGDRRGRDARIHLVPEERSRGGVGVNLRDRARRRRGR